MWLQAVHSDQWSAYNRVSSLPGIAGHSTVNHSLHFVDPSTGIHTQNIESYRNRVKCKIKRMWGCHGHKAPSCLDKFMWQDMDMIASCHSTVFYVHIAEQNLTDHRGLTI